MNNMWFLLIVVLLLYPASAIADPGLAPLQGAGLSNVFTAMSSAQPHLVPKNSNQLPRVRKNPKYAEDRILVKFKGKISEHDIASAHAPLHANSAKKFKMLKDLHLVKFPRETSIEKALESYRGNINVLYAERDYEVHTLAVPDDSSFAFQWNLQNTGNNGGISGADISASKAWDITTGSKDVVVAVIDTGVDYMHPDLSANMWRNKADCNNDGIDDDGNGYPDDCHGVDTFNIDTDPMDDNNHGTHVAGIIGAVGNNAAGVSGINWNVSIMACKFLDANGAGYVSNAIECLEYIQRMKEHGVNVVATSSSWGGFPFSQALRDAIDSHRQNGILFVAAAGNEAGTNDWYPAFPASYQLSNIIAVAATDRFDDLEYYSNEGKHTVHLGAPGSSILSTTIGNSYSAFSGTSMAAPHVSGVAALLKAQDPARDWIAIKNLILSGGDTLSSLRDTVTGKRLNASAALSCSSVVTQARLLPVGKAIDGFIGMPVKLSFLHINCASPNGEVTVTVNPGGEVLVLRDDGVGNDQVAGDGIYSAQWTPSAGGIFTLEFPNNDRVEVRVVASQDPPLFGSPVTHWLGNTFPQAVAIGDVNGDGRNDVVVTTSSYNDPDNDYRLHVFLQDASGGLGSHLKYSPGGTTPLMAQLQTVGIGDMNNDGRADVVVGSHVGTAYPDRNFIGVFLQNVDGTLAPMTRYPTNDSLRLKIGDLNNDGLPDVVGIGTVTEGQNARISIFLQNKMGTLDPPIVKEFVFENGSGGGNLDIADVNGDGLNDIIVHTQGSSGIAILYQQADGSFGAPLYAGQREWPMSGLAVGDINSDARQDIVTTFGGNYTGQIGVLLQGDAGTAGKPDLYPAQDIPTAVRIADVNSDGRNDIIVSHNGFSDLSVYIQSPGGSFFPSSVYQMWSDNFNPQAMAVGDFNGDGRADVAFADNNFGLVLMYNEATAPPVFKNISVIKGGNGAGTISSVPSGLSCEAYSCDGQFLAGTPVILKAIPDPGMVFEGWTCGVGACRENADGTCVANGGYIQARFGVAHAQLTVIKTGTGSGTVTSSPWGIDCGSDCTASYYGVDEPYNYAYVTLTAKPDPDSVFVQWINGADCSTGITCSAYMIADRTVTAVFQKKINLQKLTVSINGTGDGAVKGGGTVKSVPAWPSCLTGSCTYLFEKDYTVQLISTPDINSLFAGWVGDCANTSGNCTIIMDADKSATATFNFIQPVRIPGPPEAYFDNIGAAYAALTGSGTIQARKYEFAGNLLLNREYALNFKGGYDLSYDSNSDYSTLSGSLTIGRGSLTLERLIIK